MLLIVPGALGVTAQKHVGKTAGGLIFGDKNTLYKERAKRRLSDEATGGEMSTTYVVWKSGRLTMELGVVTTRQNFGFNVPPSCCCCLFARAMWDGGRHERGDAKRG